MEIEFTLRIDIDPETKEVKLLGQSYTEKKKKPRKAKESDEPAIVDNEPTIYLEEKKYTLNQAAADLLEVAWEDRIDIKYQKIEGVTFPVIGKDETFGTKGGNKLTKNLSVMFRGKANERLASYGQKFTLSRMVGNDGLFVLIGDKEETTDQIKDENIVIDMEDEKIDLGISTGLDLVDSTEKIDEFDFEL